MKDRWSQLSMSEKSDLMSLYIRNGISSLEEIKKHYNSFADGGRVDNNPDKDPVLKDRKPKANFYQRLLNPFRQTMPDWENRINGKNMVATHKLSWVTDDNGNAIVYPNVQEINDKLYDFTDPRNKAKKWDALDRAIQTGDTIQMTPAQANFWTQHYKEFYPSFNFATGGHLYQDGGPDDDKYSFLKREPEVAVADNTRYVRPISDVEIDRASGLPEGTTTMRRIISAQADRQQPVIKQDNTTNETHKSINKEVKKAQVAKKVNDVANAVAAVTSIPATIVAPEVMTPIFALQGFNDSTDVLSKEGNLNTEDYGRLGLDALFMLPMFNTAGNYLRFNTNLGRSYELSRALNKSIRNTELPQRIIKNPANNRFRLGDVEMDNPNLMYHVDNGDFTGFSGNGAYVKDGILFPTRNESGQTPYTWWNLGRPYRNNQSRLLTVVKDNPNLLKVRDQNYPIGQWTGNPTEKSFVTNSEYVSSKPIKIDNQYEYIPNYGYSRVQEPTPTLEQAYQEGMNTKVNGSSNSKAAPVLADALYKDASFNSDPIMQMLYNDYISGKSTFGNMFPQKTVQTGLDDDAIQLLRNRTLNRDIQAIKEDPNLSSSFLGESRIKKLNEIFDKDLPSIKVGKYSGQDYKNAGHGDWGGFYNEQNRFISINRDSGYPMHKTQAHEGLHHIDSKHSLTAEQDAALSKAFADDFNTLPETEYAPENLKDYTHMRKERITTNRDARDELLGYEDMPLEKQNQIIDQATDDAVFNAIENANGYGRAYIKRLRAENKLTHEKANAFRESMKKVGVITGIIGTGAAATQK